MNVPITILSFVRPVGILASLGAAGIRLVGLVELCLATFMNSHGYTLEMVSLYAAWVVLRGLGAFGIFSTCSLGKDLLSEERTTSSSHAYAL